MVEYEYTAVNKDGFKKGKLYAATELEAQTILIEQGLTVVSLNVHRKIGLGFLGQFFSSLSDDMHEKMGLQEKILFSSQLASMVKAGLPIVEALETFVDEKSKSGSVSIISKIMRDVQSGSKLSDALARFPKIFDATYLAIIRAGESSGTVDNSLAYLAELLRRENAILTKVRSALIYPAVVMVAMVSVMVFISVSIIPKILAFAESSGQKLPAYTVALVNGVGMITKYWYLFLILLVLVGIAFSAVAKSYDGSRYIGKMILKMPIFGMVVSRYNQARFARVLAGFYSYGVNIVTSFDILAASLGNPLYGDACLRMKDRLVLGTSLADTVAAEKELFPTIMSRLIDGAEKTGVIGDALDKLAQYYEEELENILGNILTLIEPIMVFALGIGVLGLAMVVILPIYKITSTLK